MTAPCAQNLWLWGSRHAFIEGYLLCGAQIGTETPVPESEATLVVWEEAAPAGNQVLSSDQTTPCQIPDLLEQWFSNFLGV
jgi:hypothetical protein